ncbi:CRP/FNR family transcriptional regulator [Chitinophaga polysaccharea]|uniref:CRP/FNR family transcriptional regulator n=1 Tax=Chitinophaga polysaccharea TaxID=1293035 RepID=A0A561PRB9_9BACT|nr:Crp/Fnr family transcriptional regulator [Chitinophaga polysaccharea]TWF40631.1 CRP/FNR family transcriptional regulator [Chitinophaga polysaccharea]
MQIDYNILITYGGVARKLPKGAIIFHEGGTPLFYYQVVEGSVKIFTSNADGKELIQGMFSAGQSFGEPPLMVGKCYPTTAQTLTSCVVIRIARENLLEILKNYPEITEKLLFTFAERIYNKTTAAQVWVSPTPEEKIMLFLKHLNVHLTSATTDLVPYTRQQIADFTGLRVETVIRTLVRMSKKGMVKIIDHKLYYQ